jgi:endonuclease III
VHANAFELLIATMLSAQTTDLAVNRVTRTLFRRWPSASALATADPTAVGAVIGTLGLWRSKARYLVGAAQALVDDHGGEVPRDLASLQALPGVGKKTATAVLSTAYGIPAGVTVDTHMLRINALLQLSRATTADAMSADLEKLLPPESWPTYTHRIIDHGRLVCVARQPRCGVCPLAKVCPSAFDPTIGYREENDAREPPSAAGLSWRAQATHPSTGIGADGPAKWAP